MRTILFLITFFYTSIAFANTYNFKITRIIDGDTVEFEAKFLLPELGNKLKLRILGVDTPEKGKRAKCNKEEQSSLKAKLFVEQEISNGKIVLITIKKWDKFGGRVLGDVIIDNKLLSNSLIKKGYAVYYSGKGKKKDWCE